MADIGGLQLLPETRKKIDINVPGQNRLLIFSFIFLAIVIGVYFFLFSYRQSTESQLDGLNNQFAELERSRDKALESRLLDLRKQLAVINPLLGSHVFWSQGLIKIQNATQPQVQVQSLNADALSKKMTLVGSARDYTTIARQIASFYTIDSITDIILDRVQSQPTGRLDFSMQILFAPSKLLRP